MRSRALATGILLGLAAVHGTAASAQQVRGIPVTPQPPNPELRTRIPEPPRVSDKFGAIEGTVADSAGTMLRDARMAIDGVDRIVVTDAEGRFAFTNIPLGDHVVRVLRDGFEPLAFKLSLPAPGTVHLKLAMRYQTALSAEEQVKAARTGRRSAIVGLVTDQYDVPIRLAQVSAMGTPAATLTDSAGRFRLPDLAFGPYFLRVRKVGFGPQMLTVQLTTTDSADVHVRLDSRANVLATTTITASGDRNPSRLAGFYERRKTANGFFFDAEDIARRRPPQLTDLFRASTTLTVERDGAGRQVVLGRLIGTRRCTLGLIVDGVFLRDGNALGILDQVAPPDQVRAVEVYASNIDVPAEFARPGTECGAVVVWTK